MPVSPVMVVSVVLGFGLCRRGLRFFGAEFVFDIFMFDMLVDEFEFCADTAAAAPANKAATTVITNR